MATLHALSGTAMVPKPAGHDRWSRPDPERSTLDSPRAPCQHRCMDKADKFEASALDHAERIASMTDDDVRRAYLATDGEDGAPWVEALIAELQTRGIDV